MRRASALLVVAAAVSIAIALGPPPCTPASPCTAEPGARGVRDVAATLVVPARWPTAFAITADGVAYYTDRYSGEIRAYDPASRSSRVVLDLPHVVSDGERGLLGLALHPRFPDEPFVYAYYTHATADGPRNEIVRFRDDGAATNVETLASMHAAAAGWHNGGAIAFGPDGYLYATVGDAHHPANAQFVGTEAGKILRMTAGGAVPVDDPFHGTSVWSIGHRNSFGITWDPLTDALWQTENGPACNDELNRIERGGNYGWGPNATCAGVPIPPGDTNVDGPEPRHAPEWFTRATIAPTGLAFCDGCGLPGQEGRLVMGDCNLGDLHALTLDATRRHVVAERMLFDGPRCVLDVERGADGTLYFSDPTGIYRLGQAATPASR